MTNQIVRVAVDSLQPHPRQADFFAPPSENDIAELAEDISKRGQREPVRCTPDLVLLSGHSRTKAAKQLGLSHINAIILDDFPDACAPEAIRELVSENLHRRHLDDLSLARCYAALKEQWAVDQDIAPQGVEARDWLAEKLGCGKSGRTLDRLVRLLELPMPVQHAISAGVIKKAHGEKLLGLEEVKQHKFADSLAEGVDPTELLKEYGLISAPKGKKPATIAQDLIKKLKTDLPILMANIGELDRLQIRGADINNVLNDAAQFFSDWHDRKQELRAQSYEASHFPNVGGISAKLEKRQAQNSGTSQFPNVGNVSDKLSGQTQR